MIENILMKATTRMNVSQNGQHQSRQRANDVKASTELTGNASKVATQKYSKALNQLNCKAIKEFYLSEKTTKAESRDKTMGLRAAKAPAEALGGAPVLHSSPLQHRTQLPLRMPKKEV